MIKTTASKNYYKEEFVFICIIIEWVNKIVIPYKQKFITYIYKFIYKILCKVYSKISTLYENILFKKSKSCEKFSKLGYFEYQQNVKILEN